MSAGTKQIRSGRIERVIDILETLRIDAASRTKHFSDVPTMSNYCEGVTYGYERAIELLKEAIE